MYQRSRFFFSTIILCSGLWISCGPKNDPSKKSEPYPPTELMPTSPLLYRNQLSNGLTYFIHENPTPYQRAELRLVIRAGSVLEEEDQQGLAHFVEHMAFNGSENFPSTSLINHMETLGMRFGAHLNAYTSFDETVYQLTVPTDDISIMETSFLILRDQAFHLSFDPNEIEQERGVVLEEWRRSLGANTRIQGEMYADIFGGSQYGKRFPIGTEDSLRNFSHDALLRFYQDWYRPDLMAVIAVGDFDRDQVEQLIIKNFSDAKAEKSKPRPEIEIPDHSDPFFRVISDSELPRVVVQFHDQYNGAEDSTFDGYRGYIRQNIMLQLINERLGIFAQAPDAIFDGAGINHSRFNRTEETMQLSAGLYEDNIEEGYRFILTEMERLRRHGVLDSELNRAKQEVMSGYQQYILGAETLASHTKAEELIRAYLNDEPVPGTAMEFQLAEYYIPRINTDELNTDIKNILQTGSLVVQMLGPDRESVKLPTKERLQQIMEEVASSEDIAPYQEEEVDTAPLLEEPTPGEIVSKEFSPELNMHTWILSNGATVHIKSTEIKQDEVLLAAFSRGGNSTISDEDYSSISAAVSLKNRSGLGAYRTFELEKKLAGIDVSISSSIDRYFEHIDGQVTPEHLDIMMQLMYMKMTQPRFDESALKTLKRDQYANIERRKNNPMFPVQKAFIEMVWEPNIRVEPWNSDSIEQISLQKSKDLYLQKFGNASDFTFFIVGKMNLLEVEEYVQTYIASLPADNTQESYGKDGMVFRKGTHQRTVYAGSEPKASYLQVFHGKLENGDWKSRRSLQALSSAINARLLKRLREELSGVYNVSFSLEFQTAHPQEFQGQLSFGCAPERLLELQQEAEKIIEVTMKEGVSPEELAIEKEQSRRSREQSEASNHFWLRMIMTAMQKGEDPLELFSYLEHNENLSQNEILIAAEYLQKGIEGKATLLQYPLSMKEE